MGVVHNIIMLHDIRLCVCTIVAPKLEGPEFSQDGATASFRVSLPSSPDDIIFDPEQCVVEIKHGPEAEWSPLPKLETHHLSPPTGTTEPLACPPVSTIQPSSPPASIPLAEPASFASSYGALQDSQRVPHSNSQFATADTEWCKVTITVALPIKHREASNKASFRVLRQNANSLCLPSEVKEADLPTLGTFTNFIKVNL